MSSSVTHPVTPPSPGQSVAPPFPQQLPEKKFENGVWKYLVPVEGGPSIYGRYLNDDEISLLKTVFGPFLNYQRIMVFADDTKTDKRPPGHEHRSYHADGNIFMLGKDYLEDYSATENRDVLHMFFHEVAHVWQHHRGYKSRYREAKQNKNRISREIDTLYDKYKSEIAKADKILRIALSYEAQRKEDSLDALYSHFQRLQDSYFQNYDYDPIVYVPRVRRGPPYSDIMVGPMNADPHRLSDVVSRSPAFRKRTGRSDISANELALTWARNSEYNYLADMNTEQHFYNLPIEAQAQMIADYAMARFGTTQADPYVAHGKLLPIEFYENFIPFVRRLRAAGPANPVVKPRFKLPWRTKGRPDPTPYPDSFKPVEDVEARDSKKASMDRPTVGTDALKPRFKD